METLQLQSTRFDTNQAAVGALACLVFLITAYFSLMLYFTGSFHFDRWLHSVALSEFVGALAAGAVLGLLSPIKLVYAMLLGILIGSLAAFALSIVF